MKNLLYFFMCISLLGGMSSCKLDEINQTESDNQKEIDGYISRSNLKLQKSPEGMYYSINTAKSTGKQAFNTDLIKFYYKMTLLDGTKLDSTAKSLGQLKGLVWGATSNILNLPISFLKEGESGLFILPSALAFGGNSYTDIPAFSVIKLEIEVVSIRTEAEQLQDFQTLYKITNPEVSVTGLIFKKLVENPKGAQVVVGQSVKVNYTGRFSYGVLQNDATSGKIIYDSSFNTGTFTFVAGTGAVISGFDEGILKMRVGEKAVLIMPSKIAYGANGNTTIPPNSPLYFEVEVVGAL
jgi:FKBP-type peptidyl-prolyl cis-trans isomerase